MTNELDPRIDRWYAHLDKGQCFYVIAITEEENTVEVQYFDVDIEEFSFDEWRELQIELIEEPENLTAALDIADQDAPGTEITDTDPEEDCRRPTNKSPSFRSGRMPIITIFFALLRGSVENTAFQSNVI